MSLELAAYAPATGEGPRWRLVRALTGREVFAAEQLERQGFVAFLPKQLKTVRHARKVRVALGAYFPGYLFVNLDLARDRWRSVSFPGPVAGEAKSALLRDAALFVLPSHSESFGMALAEALAHATPVLTTTAVPWPTLEARGCGWRAAPTAEALAAALRVALDCDASTLAQMGANGRAFVAETLGWNGIAARFADLYAQQVRTRAAA